MKSHRSGPGAGHGASAKGRRQDTAEPHRDRGQSRPSHEPPAFLPSLDPCIPVESTGDCTGADDDPPGGPIRSPSQISAQIAHSRPSRPSPGGVAPAAVIGNWHDGAGGNPKRRRPQGRSVVRDGDRLLRPISGSSDTVRRLLHHLHEVGFSGAPKHLGREGDGFEVLTWVEGRTFATDVPRWLREPTTLAASPVS